MGPGAVALLAAVLALPSWAQKLPTRDEQLYDFLGPRPEIFHDTMLLSDGLQVTTYLLKNNTRRLYFTVEEADTAVSIIVTPCSSNIRWSLLLRKPKEESPEEEYLEEEWDPLEQQVASLKQPDGFGKVWSYSGRHRSAYETSTSPAGMYVLALKSTEFDSSVMVYASTTPHSDYPYPELPSDPTVATDDVSTETVSLSWKASRIHTHPVKYCISVNPRRNFHSHCAALGAIFGDAPPTAPPHAGFGFSWEKEKKDSVAPRPVPASPEDTSITCIGDKTSYTVTNLLPGKRYYIDVFAVNSATNRSTAYEGVRVKTQPSRKKIRIKDGKVVTAFIKGGKGSNLFHYKLKKANSINVVLQPCFGTLQVVITKDGQTLSKKVVSDFENILIANATAGRYFIEVSSMRRRSAYFKVIVSRKRKRIVYPRLPRDKSIKVFDDNTNACDALAVAWLATNQKQQYCLYVREIDDTETSLVRILRRWNKCLDPNARKRTEKVMCRNVRFKDRQRAVMTQKIRGLKPNKQYVIDVYAKKIGRKGLSLSYNSKLITTRNSC